MFTYSSELIDSPTRSPSSPGVDRAVTRKTAATVTTTAGTSRRNLRSQKVLSRKESCRYFARSRFVLIR